MINYDNIENDETMAYFNCIYRFATYDDQPYCNIMTKYHIKCMWDNLIAFLYFIFLFRQKE